MNDHEKEPFLELSRRDRERWEKDKALEKKPRDPNRPKRPPSAYFLFLAEFRKQFIGKPNPAKVSKNCVGVFMIIFFRPRHDRASNSKTKIP